MIDRSNFFYQEISTKGIGEATVVSSGPDTGANNAVACSFWRCMRNGSTNDGINQLLGRYTAEPGAAQNFNISGHGFPGFVETGKGQGGVWDYSKLMWLYNPSDWQPELQRISNLNYGIFSIYSCDTGADSDGAEFLFKISKILNKPTRARTGLTNGVTQDGRCWIEFQNGSTWQVATPQMTQPPAPIPKTPHIYDFKNQNRFFEILNKTKVEGVNYDEVEKINIVFPSPYFSHSSNIIDSKFHSLILENLFFSESFLNEGEILGFITFTVVIEITKGNTVVIDVYNNTLGKIREQNVSFFISTDLANILTKINY